MLSRIVAGFVFLMIAGIPCVSSAGILASAPDFMVSPMNLSYDAGTNTLETVGPLGFNTVPTLIESPGADPTSLFFGTGGPFPAAMPAVFKMTVQVDETGVLTPGSFEIQGAFAPGDPSLDMLSGTIISVDMAAFNAGLVLEFEADVVSGTQKSIFGPKVLISISSLGGADDFLNNFTVIGASADIGRPVPEPSSALIWCIALAFLPRSRRRR